jgi:hypothetical protein
MFRVLDDPFPRAGNGATLCGRTVIPTDAEPETTPMHDKRDVVRAAARLVRDSADLLLHVTESDSRKSDDLAWECWKQLEVTMQLAVRSVQTHQLQSNRFLPHVVEALEAWWELQKRAE